MLLVKTVIKESSIHGTGLFTEEDIEEGTPIWSYNKKTTSLITANELVNICKDLNFNEILSYLTYSYLRNDQVWCVLDDSKYINHSETPNIGFVDNFQEIALRDIKKGEELLENYHNCYDPNDFYNWNIDQVQSKETALELIYQKWQEQSYA